MRMTDIYKQLDYFQLHSDLMCSCCTCVTDNNDKNKSEILLLSLAANIVSRHSSMVGVDRDRKEKITGETIQREVPLMMSRSSVRSYRKPRGVGFGYIDIAPRMACRSGPDRVSVSTTTCATFYSEYAAVILLCKTLNITFFVFFTSFKLSAEKQQKFNI